MKLLNSICVAVVVWQMVESSRQYLVSLLACVPLTASVSFLTSLLNLKVSTSSCDVYTSADYILREA